MKRNSFDAVPHILYGSYYTNYIHKIPYLYNDCKWVVEHIVWCYTCERQE